MTPAQSRAFADRLLASIAHPFDKVVPDHDHECPECKKLFKCTDPWCNDQYDWNEHECVDCRELDICPDCDGEGIVYRKCCRGSVHKIECACGGEDIGETCETCHGKGKVKI